jgi:hypothetical protein
MVQTQELQITLGRPAPCDPSVSRLVQALTEARLKPEIPAPAVSDRFRAEAPASRETAASTSGLAPGTVHCIPDPPLTRS